MISRKDIKPDRWYSIPGHALNRLLAVADRLYDDRRLYGDERRDMAQVVELMSQNVIEEEEES